MVCPPSAPAGPEATSFNCRTNIYRITSTSLSLFLSFSYWPSLGDRNRHTICGCAFIKCTLRIVHLSPESIAIESQMPRVHFDLHTCSWDIVILLYLCAHFLPRQWQCWLHRTKNNDACPQPIRTRRSASASRKAKHLYRHGNAAEAGLSCFFFLYSGFGFG